MHIYAYVIQTGMDGFVVAGAAACFMLKEKLAIATDKKHFV